MISKFINAGSFSIILLCFLLPFLSIKCNDNKIEVFSGYDFIVGKEFNVKSPIDKENNQTQELQSDGKIGSEENRKLEPNGLMIALLVIVFLGVIVSFLKIRKGRISAIITAGISLLLLIINVILINNEFKESAAIGNQILGLRIYLGYEIGFWLMLFVFVAIIINNSILLVLDSEKRIPTSSPLNDYTPPASIDKIE